VPAIARCGSCHRSLCGECFRFRMATRPACARCAYEASTRPARRVSLAASFLCFSGAIAVWAMRHYRPIEREPWLLVFAAIPAFILAFVVALSGRSQASAVENREPDDAEVGELDLAGSSNPYRAHVRRAIHAVSPRVSGTATALIVLGSFGGAAVLLPASLKLPRWLEAEMVLGAWWGIVTLALTALLYRGFRLRDDYVYFVPWSRPAAGDTGGPKARSGGSGCSAGDGCGDVGGLDGEGALIALAVMVAIAVAFGAAWIFVELVMPLVFFLMYWLFMRAISRAARDRRGCEGDLVKSLGWAVVWATIYVVPIAAVTWLAHAVHHHV